MQRPWQIASWMIAVIFGGLFLFGAAFGAYYVASHVFDAYLPYVVAAIVWLAITAFCGGWSVGGRHGQRVKKQAEETQAQAWQERVEAEAERTRAMEDQRLAATAMKAARDQEIAAKWKSMADDAELIRQTKDLPLLSRLQAAATFGYRSNEDSQAFEKRRDAVLRKRTKAWESARRSGHRLLPIVEGQNGLCGDHVKDTSGKGCGCYLFALPPAAVHLDHVVPRSKGGPDTLENLQTLCSACNISAGNRAVDTETALTATEDSDESRLEHPRELVDTEAALTAADEAPSPARRRKRRRRSNWGVREGGKSVRQILDEWEEEGKS